MDEKLIASRSERCRLDMGDYYVVRSNNIVETHVVLEEYGRDLNALAAWAAVAEE